MVSQILPIDFWLVVVLASIINDRLKELSRSAAYLSLSYYMFDYSIQIRSERLWHK